MGPGLSSLPETSLPGDTTLPHVPHGMFDGPKLKDYLPFMKVRQECMLFTNMLAVWGYVYPVIFGNVTIGGLKVPISRFFIQIIWLHLFFIRA